MTVTTPLLIASTEDEEDEDDVPKNRSKKEEVKYKTYRKCFDFTKITAKVKETFMDRKQTFDIQYFLKSRKYFIVFMVLVFTICYLNTGDWNDNEKITVIHHSHVPGMKGKQ